MGFLDKHIPTLEGKDAERFLEMAIQNEEDVNKVDFSEQIKSFEKIMQSSQLGKMNNKFEEYLEGLVDGQNRGMEIMKIYACNEFINILGEICPEMVRTDDDIRAMKNVFLKRLKK